MARQYYLNKNGEYVPASPGTRGENGGYYAPSVSQPDAETLEFTFTKSKEDMPTIPPVSIPVPSGAPDVHIGTDEPKNGEKLWYNPDEESETPEIPSALPNPHKLTFTGAVNAKYDGSEAVEVEIPAGGGGYEHIYSVTLEEDVKAVDITVDSNGGELSLSDARMYMIFNGTSQNTKEQHVTIEPWCGTEFLARSSNGTPQINMASRITGTMYAFADFHIKKKSGYWLIAYEATRNFGFLYSKDGTEDKKITKLRLWSDGFIGAGTTIEVRGVRE